MTEKTLLRLQFSGMLALVLILTLGLGAYFTLHQTRSYMEESAALESNILGEQHDRLSASLGALHDQLQQIRHSTEAVLKRDIARQVEQAVLIARTIHAREQGRRSEEEIRSLIIETLRPLRFYDGRGYFFIDDLAGNCVLLPTAPEHEGSSLLDNRDDTGHYIMRGLLEAADNPEGRGYSRYRWYDPQQPGVMSEKIAYVRLFEPFGWLIGTGEYLSSVEQDLQREALEQLRATRIGPDGYVAVIHRDGRVLLSPSNPDAEGRHYSELPEAEQAVIRTILEASAAGGGFARYEWHGREDRQLRPRLALVSNLEDWNWALVSSLPLDRLQLSLDARQERLETSMRSGLLTTGAALVLALLLALGFSLLINRWLARRFAQYHADIEASNDRLRVWAESDPLTQLPNRTLLRSRLDGAILDARREDCKLALLFIDLDRFKNINDSLGHAIGDNLLIEVARRLSGAVRSSDTVSRLGGDEFVVLIENLTQAEQAAQVAGNLLQATSGQYDIAGHELAITLSIGIALYPSDGSDSETLLKNADAAMYHAKALGRNNYQFFTAAMNARVREHLEVENRLRQALSRSELTLHYQPQFDLASGALVGCEALMRWYSPILGQVSPDKFIGVAEDSGLILQLGEWALFEACRQVMAWEEQGLPGLSVAVNVSAVQFRHADLPAQVQAALQQSGLPAERLELELTESVLAENREQVRITLDRLKQLGVRLAMDDFGTGYSSLSYLKHFKLDTLKIDRAFISDLPGCDDHAALAVAIIGMAEALGMTCIAEGIENEEQHAFLRRHGCAVGQGFLFSRPLSAPDMAALLATRAGQAAGGEQAEEFMPDAACAGRD